MKSVSLTHVAQELNISRITVSKVINNHPGVSEDMKIKVITKLHESGYKNLLPEHLKYIENNTETSLHGNCIAVVTIAPDFSDFWLKIINSISKALNKMGYDFIYSILQPDSEGVYSLPKIICPQNVSGVIVINVYENAVINLLKKVNLPTVYLDTTPEVSENGTSGDLVLFGDENAVFTMTKSLIDKGITSLGFIGDITYSKTIKDRYSGFKRALSTNNILIDPKLNFTSCPKGHYYYKAEIKEVVDHYSKQGFPRAIVCANDFIAFLLIAELKKSSIRVPQDIAITGFDNIREKVTGGSCLTTANVDTDLLGDRLAREVIMHIENPDYPKEIISITPDIIYRESTNI